MTARSVIIATIDQLEAQAASKHADAITRLKVIQARLGTADEQPNDLEAVLEIAHSMKSTETVLYNAHLRAAHGEEAA
jgi:hypothetical protein